MNYDNKLDNDNDVTYTYEELCEYTDDLVSGIYQYPYDYIPFELHVLSAFKNDINRRVTINRYNYTYNWHE